MPLINKCGGAGSSSVVPQLPEQIENLYVTEGILSATLTWDSPSVNQDNSYKGVRIVRKEGSCPANINDGTVVYEGSGIVYADSGLIEGTTYYYRAFAYNADKKYQTSMRSVNITAIGEPDRYIVTITGTVFSSSNGYVEIGSTKYTQAMQIFVEEGTPVTIGVGCTSSSVESTCKITLNGATKTTGESTYTHVVTSDCTIKMNYQQWPEGPEAWSAAITTSSTSGDNSSKYTVAITGLNGGSYSSVEIGSTKYTKATQVIVDQGTSLTVSVGCTTTQVESSCKITLNRVTKTTGRSTYTHVVNSDCTIAFTCQSWPSEGQEAWSAAITTS